MKYSDLRQRFCFLRKNKKEMAQLMRMYGPGEKEFFLSTNKNGGITITAVDKPKHVEVVAEVAQPLFTKEIAENSPIHTLMNNWHRDVTQPN